MLAMILTALLAATPGADTVMATDGTRLTGTVIEESPSAGITIQLLDGSFRSLEPRQIARIEYADGSVSVPGTVTSPASLAPAAPSVLHVPPPEAPPRAPARAEGPLDTVYFMAGGRVRGTVIEESPREGVTIRLLDGSVRNYLRSELVRIEYADGSVSRRRQPSSRQAVPTYPVAASTPTPPVSPPNVPPAYAPPYQAPHGGARGPISPLYAALGIGATIFGGDAQAGIQMSRLLEPQAHISGEFALRLAPEFALGVYGDIGAGDPAREVRDTCRVTGIDCVATSGHVGGLARFTFDAATPTSKWLSIGTGWEFGRVTVNSQNGAELFKYTGREYLRFGAGVDFRANPALGVGFYGQVGLGSYTQLRDPTGSVTLPERNHTTVLLGVRLVLFP
jgi:hypothetical protein